jgi:glycerol-3-phosphate dehydrogenase
LKINKDLNYHAKYESGQTLNFALIGSYSKSEITDGLKMQNEDLFKKYEDHFVFEYDVPRVVAKHIVRTYGTAGKRVLELGRETNSNKLLTSDESQHFLESEVLFAIKY